MERESPLTARIHRLDGSIHSLLVPSEALSRLYLFCHLAELNAVAFEFVDEGDRVRVDEDVGFERFAILLQREGIKEAYEVNDDAGYEEEESDSFEVGDSVMGGEGSTSLQPHHFSRIRLLGQGASGTCHLAVNRRTGERVAIKSIDWAEEEMVRKQLRRELETLRKCENMPNIVRLLGEMQDGPCKLLVFEYMDGKSLDRYSIVPPRVLSVVSYSLLLALTFMKRLKVMHRDIKRANVLVSRSGEVKLCDMGMSRILPPNASAAISYVGDNYYMPPERLLGLQYRTASEIWGWAVVVCECALGRHPFLRREESLPRDFVRIVERRKKGAALVEEIRDEYGEEMREMLRVNTGCNPSTRWDLVKIHASPYIQQSKEISQSEAAEWFASHPIHDEDG